MLIELYSRNYNTNDGLVNGFYGIFKDYINHENFDIVWIKFSDPNVGQEQKIKYAIYYNQYINKEWIPIVQITRLIQKIATSKKITIRKQFPIQLACVCTIHISQGLAMEALAFDPIAIRQHQIAYTTLSRTKSIHNLFLLNPLTSKFFQVKQTKY